jgi:hypothetical protein
MNKWLRHCSQLLRLGKGFITNYIWDLSPHCSEGVGCMVLWVVKPCMTTTFIFPALHIYIPGNKRLIVFSSKTSTTKMEVIHLWNSGNHVQEYMAS